ncbi:MAG: hypothetical protein QM783_05805 [Phycisphaerales bacterium]
MEQPSQSEQPASQAPAEESAPQQDYYQWAGPLVQPSLATSLSNGQLTMNAVLSPDGKSLWVLADEPTVDVGRLLNQHSTDFMNAGCAIAAVLLILWGWRSARRRRTHGVLHCRRCDYDVTTVMAQQDGSADTAKCPECGVSLARHQPLPGVGPARRLAAPLLLAGVFALMYAWHISNGMHRYLPLFPIERWASPTLLRWSADPRLTWINAATVEGESLLELDSSTGVQRRVITTRPLRTDWRMEYNRAARAVFLKSADDGVALVSVIDGATVARAARQFPQESGRVSPYLAGQSEDGETAWLNTMDDVTGNGRLVEWRWRSGAARTIVEESSYRPGAWSYPRHYLRLAGTPIRFFRYPSFMEALPSKTYPAAILDEAGRVLVSRDLGPRIAAERVPSVSGDGSRVYMVNNDLRTANSYSTETLEPGTPFAAPTWPTDTAVSPSGRFLMVPSTDCDATIVIDLHTGQYVARLVHPGKNGYADSIHFSADEHTVCSVFPNPSPATVAVWKLPESVFSTQPATAK